MPHGAAIQIHWQWNSKRRAMMENPIKPRLFAVPTALLARQLMPLRQNFPPIKVARMQRSAFTRAFDALCPRGALHPGSMLFRQRVGSGSAQQR
jgi:hypothetical protein